MDDAMNRHQGYNLAVKMCFASQEDMVFYDNECKAHAVSNQGVNVLWKKYLLKIENSEKLTVYIKTKGPESCG